MQVDLLLMTQSQASQEKRHRLFTILFCSNVNVLKKYLFSIHKEKECWHSTYFHVLGSFLQNKSKSILLASAHVQFADKEQSILFAQISM
jgi:hypothetical protein